MVYKILILLIDKLSEEAEENFDLVNKIALKEAIKQLDNECIDLTVTSPPYDNLRTYNGYSWDFESIAKELYRVTKQGGVVVWIVGDKTVKGSETGTSFKQALFFKEIGFNVELFGLNTIKIDQVPLFIKENNEEIYVEDLRIIDDYTFYKANTILKNRTRKKGSSLKYTNRNEDNKYEGLIFHKCPDGKISKLHINHTYPNGHRYTNLICNNCKDHRYKTKKTYGIIGLYKRLDKEIDNVLSSLNSDKIETELHKKKDCIIHNLESEIKIKKEKLKEENKLLEGLNDTLDKIFRGEIKFDLQQMLDRVSETQAKIVEQEKSIKQLEEELKIEKSKEENQHKLLDKFKNFKNIYDIGTDEQKKMALRELVDRIIIDTNDNITIELKYIEV